jgi:hypothetical protein
VDWHQVAGLVRRECPPALALRIVRAPREDDVDVTVRERDRVRPFLVLHGDAGHGA